jgi:small subunit ribosomal protein S1
VNFIMSENFAELFRENIAKLNLNSGSIIKAKVIDITPEYVVVDAGLKSEDYVAVDEFKNKEGALEVAIGDEVEVMLETIEDGAGGTILSRDKAKRQASWQVLEQAFQDKKTVKGTIVERVRGGFTVELDKVRAFLPASLIDVRPVRDMSYLEGKELDFKLVKLDKKHNNVVVSRRAIISAKPGEEGEATLAKLQEGQEVIGIVKNLTDYGAFIDLGGVDGLLHITDMSWKRIKHPSEVIAVGDEIKVKVLKFDSAKNRVSLGLKQLGEDPWIGIGRRYPVGTRLFGKVTNLTDYGCFVEIETGIEGLVHVSEMDWTNKNVHPARIVSVGDEIEVMVLEIDEDRRRISLGIKQCQTNPWQVFADTHKKGEKITGKIRSITDFGIFIGLEGNIDGLVHLSDISWTEPGEKVIRNYKKGQEVEAVILAIDPERERISLGIKQLEEDVCADYFATHPKGTVVTGKITAIEPKVATVDLGDGIIGKLRVAEISKTHIKDATEIFAIEDEIQATVIGFDKKARFINLSTKEFISGSGSEPSNTKLGDLLKEKIEHTGEGE